MFGFGGKIPGFEKAKTIKKLCENLENTNLTKENLSLKKVWVPC